MALAIRSANQPRVEDLDRAGFARLEPSWDRLLERTGHDFPFYRHEFLRVWLDAFAPTGRLHVLLLEDALGPRAALCLLERRVWLHGLPLRHLAGTANEYSERFDLIAAPDDAEAIEALWRYLRDRLRWHLLELPAVPAHDGAGGEGAAHALLDRARHDGMPVGTWESAQVRFIPLAGGFRAVLDGRPGKFRQNLRRRRRRLAEHGAVTLEREAGGPHLAARLEEGLALEASGWKGRGGTAIAQVAPARAFYSALAREAARRGYLSLYFLRAGGRAVAFHLGLTYRGRYYLPKLGIDEEHRACSPGQLLMEDVVQDACGRGLDRIDFLGPDMPWKQDWTEHARPHHHCYVFRRTLIGRGLHAAKFRLAPLVREVASWR